MFLEKYNSVEIMEEESIARSEDDILKILLATDNHLGYNEKDPIRG